jgi:DNA-binding MarR family transcriptional regulator
MKKLTLPDYQALAEFRYQIRKFFHFSEHAVQAAGLERGQYQLMLAIKGIPAGVRPRIRELANRMQIQHNSAVELVNRLEARGYVRRERAQDDRREVLLALTPKGERVLAELALHHQDELRSAAPSLVAALRRLMPKTARKVSNRTVSKSPSGAKAPDNKKNVYRSSGSAAPPKGEFFSKL